MLLGVPQSLADLQIDILSEIHTTSHKKNILAVNTFTSPLIIIAIVNQAHWEFFKIFV